MKRGIMIGKTAVVVLFMSCNSAESGSDKLFSSFNDTVFPVIYDHSASLLGDHAFYSIPASERRVKLIPDLGTRVEMGLKIIDSVSGVHQFLLDHDLVSGYVHQYTINMFNRLGPDGFLVKYEPLQGDRLTGRIKWIRKKELTAADTLGRNVGFFRQWKLSEIDLGESDGRMLCRMAECKYYTRCVCPQCKPGTHSETQIPFMQRGDTGYVPIEKFSAFGPEDGGTVVIVWEQEGKNMFQDIHSSWKDVLLRALEIAKAYRTDPVICISDAGPFSHKVRADKNNRLHLEDLDALAPHATRSGAGYAYVSAR